MEEPYYTLAKNLQAMMKESEASHERRLASIEKEHGDLLRSFSYLVLRMDRLQARIDRIRGEESEE